MPASARFWSSLSVVILGQALRISFGEYHPAPLVLLGGALCALVVSFASDRSDVSPQATQWLLASALAAEVLFLFVTPPGLELKAAGGQNGWFFAALVILFALSFVLWLRPKLRGWWFPSLLFTHLFIAGWVLAHAGIGIDVQVFQEDASQALLTGQNPYAITYADPYRGQSEFYGDGLAAGGRLLFGYPYPPVSLLLALPGHLAGDVRFAHVAAVMLSAVLMYRMATDSTGKLAAALFLFTPWIFQLESFAWIDSFVVCLFASAIYAQMREPKLLPCSIGLFIAVKQYGLLLIPAIIRTISFRTLVSAAMVVLAVTVPFIIWNPVAFIDSVVLLQFRQPWRTDALSFAVLLNNLGLPRMPWLGFAAGSAVAIFVALRPDRHPATLARNVAFVFLVFFAFSKQAFYNYYFLVVGMLCCGVAAGGPESFEERPQIE